MMHEMSSPQYTGREKSAWRRLCSRVAAFFLRKAGHIRLFFQTKHYVVISETRPISTCCTGQQALDKMNRTLPSPVFYRVWFMRRCPICHGKDVLRGDDHAYGALEVSGELAGHCSDREGCGRMAVPTVREAMPPAR